MTDSEKLALIDSFARKAILDIAPNLDVADPVLGLLIAIRIVINGDFWENVTDG